jgi:hypothetical protein
MQRLALGISAIFPEKSLICSPFDDFGGVVSF